MTSNSAIRAVAALCVVSVLAATTATCFPHHGRAQHAGRLMEEAEEPSPRVFGTVVDSYLRLAERFDAANPLRRIQKLGLSHVFAHRVATVNRAFNSAWYRARSYYYAAQSGLSSLAASLPESTRERLLARLVYDGIPSVMNATGWFAPSAVEWAVDTGGKVLDAYKKDRQAARRRATSAGSVEAESSSERASRRIRSRADTGYGSFEAIPSSHLLPPDRSEQDEGLEILWE